MSEKELRELYAWIAEKVMGLRWFVHAPDVLSCHPGKRFLALPGDWQKLIEVQPAAGTEPIVDLDGKSSIPHYTTNPADAFEVLKKCVERLPMTLEISTSGGKWWVGRPDADSTEAAMAETLELAIVLFAQKLFGGAK